MIKNKTKSEPMRRLYEFEIEASGDDEVDFARFCYEFFKLALKCFPLLLFKKSQDVSSALCPKVDIDRASNPE